MREKYIHNSLIYSEKSFEISENKWIKACACQGNFVSLLYKGGESKRPPLLKT
jgi:hypothetical protein